MSIRFITLVAVVVGLSIKLIIWKLINILFRISEPQSKGESGRNTMPVLNVQMNAAPHPVFIPETFTGTGREWSDWADQFEMAGGINELDDELK